jgi:hypothetical protein
MVEATKTDQKSKAQTIRDYLDMNKRAKPEDVVKALAEQGITITERHVHSVKCRDKHAKKRRSSKSEKNGKTENKTVGRKRGGKNRPYPPRTLEESIAVPKVIREVNNGNPWATDQVAKALDLSRSSLKFFYLAAASRDYGLTVGSRDTDQIELSDLGKDIFFAKDEDTRRQKQIDAFFSVDLFKKVYDYYGGGNIPTQEFFGNYLQHDLGVDPEFHDEFAKIFTANCQYLDIENGLGPLASDKVAVHGVNVLFFPAFSMC